MTTNDLNELFEKANICPKNIHCAFPLAFSSNKVTNLYYQAATKRLFIFQ